jgi:hypothetical protein
MHQMHQMHLFVPDTGSRASSLSTNKKYVADLKGTAVLLLPGGRGSWPGGVPFADDGLRSGPEPNNSVRQTCRILRIHHRCAADRRQANSHGLRPESKAKIPLPPFAARQHGVRTAGDVLQDCACRTAHATVPTNARLAVSQQPVTTAYRLTPIVHPAVQGTFA